MTTKGRMYIKKPSYSSESSSPLRIPSFRSRSKSRQRAEEEVDDRSVAGSEKIYHTSSHDDRRSERRRSSRGDESLRRSRSQGRRRHDDEDDDRRERRERRRDDDDRRERRERRSSRSTRHHDDDDSRSERRSERRRSERSSRSHRDDRHDDHRDDRRKTSSSSKKRTSSKSAAAAAEPPARKKVEIPTNVNYRPGRIQSLTADQEMIHKQYWAYFLAYWGYPINIPTEELHYTDIYVASTGRPGGDGLARTATRNSVTSATTASSKKKRGMFGGGGGGEQPASTSSQFVANPAPANAQRLHDIQTKSSSEKYIPVDVPSPEVVNCFVNHYKLSFEFDPDYVDDGDDEPSDGGISDEASVESFVTADTTITTPDDTPTYSKAVSKGGRTSNGSMMMPSVPKKPIHSHNTNSDLSTIPPLKWQQMLIGACRNDLPDNFMLRFMRARKWNTGNACAMLSKSIKWRSEFPADDWVFEADGPSYLHHKNAGFVKNLTTEKSWIKGEDNDKNPIFWFQAKKHFGSDSPADETQRYAVTTIEWVRLFLRDVHESVDTVSIVFDLTGFSLKNADYTTIKFLADVFEAHYPECLGRIYVHNAPWIFSTVWNIIKNWLDPVVASKIVFTKNYKEMSGYISPDYIPADLGGIDTSGPEYPIPQPGDDKPRKAKDATYRRLRKERDVLFMRLFTCTSRWVEATNPDVSAKYFEEKVGINIELSDNWIQLNEYIRNPGPYDRIGNLVVRN